MQFKDLQNKVQYDYSLAKHTSWRVGGKADVFYQPAHVEDLRIFLRQIPKKINISWLGLGSNTLIRDGGIRGVVIKTLSGLNQIEVKDTTIYAQAGVTTAKLAKQQEKQSLGGLEFFAGIPGTVGGALRMNAGCFGSQTWDYVSKVFAIIPNKSKRIVSLEKKDFTISYRSVSLKNNPDSDIWFIGSWFTAKKQLPQITRDTIKTLLNQRNKSQPIGTANSGSVFKNPKGDYAGRLIEEAGLKGYSVGQAQLSVKHCNFIVNRGGANATEIESLITIAKKKVLHVCNTRLQTEVQIIGEVS